MDTYNDFYNKNINNIKILINKNLENKDIIEYINNFIEKEIDIFIKKKIESCDCNTSQKSTSKKKIYGNISEI